MADRIDRVIADLRTDLAERHRGRQRGVVNWEDLDGILAALPAKLRAAAILDHMEQTEGRGSVRISGLWLRREGDDLILDVELPDRAVEAIRERCAGMECEISHHVAPLGILSAKAAAARVYSEDAPAVPEGHHPEDTPDGPSGRR